MKWQFPTSPGFYTKMKDEQEESPHTLFSANEESDIIHILEK